MSEELERNLKEGNGGGLIAIISENLLQSGEPVSRPEF
jgi:hypothetical protein